jgi:hypothetical protein
MASLSDILTSLQQGVQAVNNLTTQLKTSFPSVVATSTSATTGTATIASSEPALFGVVTTSSGGTYKVALYNQ